MLADLQCRDVVSLKILPMLGQLTILPAVIGGWLLASVALNLISLMLRKLGSTTTSFKQESAIGIVGDLTTPIAPGKTGEITFVVKGGRTTAPARCRNQAIEIKKLSKVIIVDIENGIHFVEPYDEDGMTIKIHDPQKISD